MLISMNEISKWSGALKTSLNSPQEQNQSPVSVCSVFLRGSPYEKIFRTFKIQYRLCSKSISPDPVTGAEADNRMATAPVTLVYSDQAETRSGFKTELLANYPAYRESTEK